MSRPFLAALLRFMLPVFVLTRANAATPRVITVVGGYRGDGKVATSASFSAPNSIAIDVHGNTYIADGLNCRIRKISVKNVVTTFAGNGTCGYSGDPGLARSAKIFFPSGIAIDGHGSLLFGDYANARIRNVDSHGTITTIAGNGIAGYSGDGGPAIQASISDPSDVAIDSSGNVYIADWGNFVIRMIDANGNIHTVAGNGKFGFSGDGGPAVAARLTTPQSVRVDNSGNIYIADSGNSRIRKVDSSGTITTIAGNGSSGNTGNAGPTTSASIGNPEGVLIGNGVLYISTPGNIWAVDLATEVINLIGGSSSGTRGFNGDGLSALSTEFSQLMGMSLDSTGKLLVADSANDRIREIDSAQTVTTNAGGYIGDGGAPILSSLNLGPSSHSSFDPAGNMYIVDSKNFRVRRVTPNGTITTFAGNGMNGYTGDGGLATSATFGFPDAVASDSNGNIFVSDEGNAVIRKVDTTGTITTFSTPIIPLLGGHLPRIRTITFTLQTGFGQSGRLLQPDLPRLLRA